MAVAVARPTMLPQLQARLLAGMAHQRSAAPRAFRMTSSRQQQQQQEQAATEQQRQRPSLSLVAATPTATQLLAHFFACDLRPADCYLLYGSVGAGKSYFSRAFIRAAADDEELPVPSPTFLLQNVYTDHQGPAIHHFDLYRLTQQYDLARLDLQASFSQAVSLVEWPERLAGSPHLPAEHLAVHIAILEPAEQDQLQQQQQQQQHQHAAGSSSSSSSASGGGPGPGEVAAATAEEAEEEGFDGSSSSDDDGSGDLRWRRIQLAASGQRWQPRLQLLRQYLQAEGAQLGCFVESAGP